MAPPRANLHRPAWIAVIVASLLFGTAAAYAEDIFLNGVKVNGLTDQDFKTAKVRFDAKGNVHITVDNISVSVQGEPDKVAQTRPQRLEHAYFLVTSQTNPGSTQFDIDININGKQVTRVRSADKRQVTINITKHLRPGKNLVVFTAIKRLDDARRSFSPSDEFSVILGEGKESGNQLTIERTMARYTRTGADVQNHSQTFEIMAE
jgi:hypothetical protein